MGLFYSIFFTTNLIFSFILCSFYLRLVPFKNQQPRELILYFLGLGPAFTILILYYLFLLVPGKSSPFYMVTVFSVYLLMAAAGRKYFGIIISSVFNSLKDLFSATLKFRIKLSNFLILVIITSAVLCYFFILFGDIVKIPLKGHDVLHYGIVGQMLFEAKSLLPVWIEDYSSQGFIYRVTCAPGFSLTLTWEKIIGSIFNADTDAYFKSISGYYAVLIVLVQFFLLARLNKWLGILSSVALISSVGFYVKFFLPHIDTFRIFFLMLSFIYLAYSVKDRDLTSLILFGVFTGFTMYAHRIGIVIGAVNFGVLFIMMSETFKNRIMKSFFTGILILLFGGSHYILDLILGRGVWWLH